MYRLINFAVNLMERENDDPDLLPSQNPRLHPSQNRDLNDTHNRNLNIGQNQNINWNFNQSWRKNQWELFQETILWEKLTEGQRERCQEYHENS